MVAASTVLAGAVGPVTANAATTPTTPTTHLTVASMNVLGASHTLHSTRYASGARRMHGQVRLIQQHAVDVVGFQELQKTQLTKFLSLTADTFATYPDPADTTVRDTDRENSIAWRTATWTLVSAETVDIPYFDGHIRHMPVVELSNNATGVRAWFANFHNPATNPRHRHQWRWRKQAIADEVALGNRLNQTGVPVVFTGDMNERARVFCPMTGQAPMTAARGGSNVDGVCDPMHPWYVDWIFGSKKLSYDNYVEDRTPVDKHLSDHPMIVTGVGIDSASFPAAVPTQ